MKFAFRLLHILPEIMVMLLLSIVFLPVKVLDLVWVKFIDIGE